MTITNTITTTATRTLLVLVAGAACSSSSSFRLSGTPDTLPADGETIIELLAEVTFRGEPLATGKRVTFSADAPLLFDSKDDATALAPGGRQSGKEEVDGASTGGEARAYLLAPTGAATITINASITLARETLDDTLVIDTGPPPLVSGGQVNDFLQITETHFRVDCNAANIGAFVGGRPDINVDCSVTSKRFDGTDLWHAPVQFHTEAGRMEEIPADRDTPRAFNYVAPATGGDFPADTSPDDLNMIERNAGFVVAGSGYIPGAVEQNPRDGLVTILAVVRGQEAFRDLNSNGTYDAGEPWVDEGEPFLDVNDDGAHTSVDPPHCCDTNGNGSVDGPNGTWDADVWIGRTTHILWSGEVDTTLSGITPLSPSILAESGETFTVRAVDSNSNPVAALGSGDDINFSASPSSRIGFSPVGCPPGAPGEGPLRDAIGMDLLEFPQFVFGRGESSFDDLATAGGLYDGREWCFRLQDERNPSGSTICTPDNFTATATLDYTAGRGSGFSGVPPDAVLSAAGTLLAKPMPCP